MDQVRIEQAIEHVFDRETIEPLGLNPASAAWHFTKNIGPLLWKAFVLDWRSSEPRTNSPLGKRAGN